MRLDQPVAWAEARWYDSLRLRKERAPAARTRDLSLNHRPRG
jgi:hypothetical protein